MIVKRSEEAKRAYFEGYNAGLLAATRIVKALLLAEGELTLAIELYDAILVMKQEPVE